MKPVGKNSRHIRIKYYFVTDRVKDKELKIIYCPTKEMVADFFTKSLQGVLFVTHRNTVLGISQDDKPLMKIILIDLIMLSQHKYAVMEVVYCTRINL